MSNIFAVSDHHFGHANILKFTDSQGELIRGSKFANADEMDECMIERHNSVVTSDSDIVYFLGDLTFDINNLKNIMPRLRGRKRLLIGNHDNPKNPELLRWFQKVGLWRIFKDEGVVFSHIPLPEDQFRWKVAMNGHGHIHQNLKEGPYMNLCVEHTDYTPVSMDVIVERAKACR